MKNIGILFIAILPMISFSKESSPFIGLWQFPGSAVYVQILDSGNTFQCRIAMDNSVIKANGKLIGESSIQWDPITIESASGDAIDPQEFEWGVDKVNLHKGVLTLSGRYGEFSYEKCCTKLPKECTN